MPFFFFCALTVSLLGSLNAQITDEQYKQLQHVNGLFREFTPKAQWGTDIYIDDNKLKIEGVMRSHTYWIPIHKIKKVRVKKYVKSKYYKLYISAPWANIISSDGSRYGGLPFGTFKNKKMAKQTAEEMRKLIELFR